MKAETFMSADPLSQMLPHMFKVFNFYWTAITVVNNRIMVNPKT